MMVFFKTHAILLVVLLGSAASFSENHAHISTSLFSKASSVLSDATQTEQASAHAIMDANKFRKDINRLRAKARKTQNEKQRQALTLRADKLASDQSKQQRLGAKLRKKAKELKNKAVELLEEAMVEQQNSRILSRRPIMMGESQTMFFAHNTKFRSVHPSMLDKMSTPTQGLSRDSVKQDMSILVPALAEQNAPQNLDISSFQLSRKQHHFAHIEVAGSGNAPMNKIHKWHLIISELSGKPLAGANIEVVGHMPGHVHGLPTQPRVTKELSPGIYLVEGLKFQMHGWWVIQFNILTEQNLTNADKEFVNKANTKFTPAKIADSIVFNLVL